MESRRAQLAVVVIMLGGVCSSLAFALSPMGPPKAMFGEGRWAAGFGYAHQAMDLDLSGKVRENLGSGWLTADYTKYKIKNLTSNTFLGILGYGVRDNWDAFVHIGAADAKDEIAETLGCGRPGNRYYGYSGNYGPAWGFGTRTTICQEANLSWGGLFQITWSEPDSSNIRLRGDSAFSGDFELDFWEIQIAAGPTLQLDGFSIYGGPFSHFVKGDFNLKGTTVDSMSVTQLVRSKGEIREESIFGAYGGVQWDIAENTSWYAEYQLTGDAYGIGVGVVWKF